MAPERQPSAATQRGTAFVDAHRQAAVDLGRRLADLVGDPEAFEKTMHEGLRELADPEYQAGQHHVAPRLGRTYGVRTPLLTVAARAMRKASVGTSPALLLFAVERLLADDVLELRWFAFHLLDETLRTDPTRSWQLLRRAARDAADWITVDALAHPLSRGILREPFRWAEIEQLAFSASPWERRLVGSTIATIPFANRTTGRTPDYVQRSLSLLGTLIGDADPDVQKALAWAYRSVAMVDPTATAAALSREADLAATTADGHRAWVIRDAAPKLAPADAAALKRQLIGIRRVSGSPATSTAAQLARRFGAPPTDTATTNVR